MKKLLLSIGMFLFVALANFSQSIDLNLPSYNPSSPEAASLGGNIYSKLPKKAQMFAHW